jgi:predicted nucleotidyltransferase
MRLPEGLPEEVRSALGAFVTAAIQGFAEDLSSIVLFGSAAEGRLRATSDVNVMVVLGRAEPTRLAAIGNAYRLAHAAIRLSAMFILEAEIPAASDAFAVKFADVSSRHFVVHGTDPLARLSIDPEAAKRRLGQVLINLVLRLRERLVAASIFPDQLAFDAADSVGPLRASAALLLSLGSGERLTPRDALIRLAEEGGRQSALALIDEARQTGGVPAAGGAASVEASIEIASFLAARIETLGRE